jgi:hypothetical protein
MARTLPIILALLLTTAFAPSAHAEQPDADDGFRLLPDKPTARAKSGDVTGTISPAGRVASVRLVSRETGESRKPDAWDADSGKFAFRKLPGAAGYDVAIRTADGRRIEGIDLSFTDERLLKLAEQRRRELGIKNPEPRKFTKDDAARLVEFAQKHGDFMDLRRPLYIRGDGRRATMLVELMRTRDFHAGRGQYVWRIELWYFENYFGGWARVDNQERLLERMRTTPAGWRKMAIEYRPELSVRIDAEGESEPVKFTLPEKIDPSRGRPANTKPDLDTKPHVIIE